MCFDNSGIPVIAFQDNGDSNAGYAGKPEVKVFSLISGSIFRTGWNGESPTLVNSVNLNNYSCIHLRLEDDAINYMKDYSGELDFDKVNDIYKNKYLTELEYLKKNINDFNHKIYVCTSLNIDNNKNNEFYRFIKEKYNLLDKNDIINVFLNKCDCREIYGIIDFIIAKDSIYFIGSDWSSYSIYLFNNHTYNSKSAKLINIWRELTK
jgi:hypothetical protein